MTKLRALLVEDDDVDALLFQQCVAGLSGLGQLTFSRVDHLAAAIQHLQALDVDVVLLDLGLPDSQGLETFRRLQEMAPHAPVVVLTGTLDDEVARAAVAAGAQDFIGKDELTHVQLERVLRYAVERHRMQAQLEASEARFRKLVELADDALVRVLLDPEPQLEYVSPAIHGITAIPAEALLADPSLFTDRIHPDDLDAWRDRAQLAEGVPTCLLYRWRRSEDAWVWLEERRTPLFEQGRLVAVQGVIRDVTITKQAETVLQTALEQERAAVEKLRTLDQMKTTFLQAVSHELRTPLTVVRGFALTLQAHGDQLPTAQRATLVDRLVAASARLEKLLQDLLDVDRLDRGLVRAEARPTDVSALVCGVLSELDSSRHPVSVDCEQDLTFPLDAAKVERIVENLVMNACKHTPDGTSVHVGARHDERGLILTVADDGPGIPVEDRERLFEPFAQGAQAGSNASPGTGIGLTLVARFAELHGGSVRIEPTPGGGATFVVTLPAPPAPTEVPAQRASDPLEAGPGSTGARAVDDGDQTDDAATDPPVSGGLEGRTALREVLARAGEGDALLRIDLTTIGDAPIGPPAHVETAAGVIRSCLRAFDRGFLLDPWTFVVVLPQADRATLEARAERLRAAFDQQLPGVLLRTDGTEVGTRGGAAAYRELSGGPDA